jgi:zinc finger-containing ubiquitin peptidase 1
MFLSLGIACDAQGMKAKKDRKDADPAHVLLFKAVEAYFANGCTDFDPKVRCTSLPPLYFQHPGKYLPKP